MGSHLVAAPSSTPPHTAYSGASDLPHPANDLSEQIGCGMNQVFPDAAYAIDGSVCSIGDHANDAAGNISYTANHAAADVFSRRNRTVHRAAHPAGFRHIGLCRFISTRFICRSHISFPFDCSFAGFCHANLYDLT
jgi:hypothetical protein